jgi:phosphatidylglycerophosphate synthase
LLRIVGDCQAKIFGLRPADRLRRQLRERPDSRVVAHASAVIDDAALQWLLENPGKVLSTAVGRPLAVAVSADDEESAASGLVAEGTLVFPPECATGERFVRKLRRRVAVAGFSLLEEPARRIERRLFGNVYKGVTDLVTKWVWPWPAFQVTRVCARLGITPNMVTLAGLVLVFVAGWLFWQGNIAAGLAAAWGMTFLDTVDGKLARVTATSSRVGDILDHGTDILHPPVWWYLLAVGIERTEGSGSPPILLAFWIILGCYIVGRLIEEGFKRRFGFNQYIWEPFDSRFRLIVSRRNTILLLMTLGVLLVAPDEAYWLAAIWSVVSTFIQFLRFSQASAAARRGRPIQSWLA